MSTRASGRLSYEIAQRIIERVAPGQRLAISIVAPSGEILASTAAGADDSRAGRVGLPLRHGDSVVGAVIVSDASPYGREVAYMAQALAELIIHQATAIEQLTRQQWARDRFVFNLLHEALYDHVELVEQEAALLQIDLHLPRVVVAIETAAVERAAEQIERIRRTMGNREQDIVSTTGARQFVILATIDAARVNASRKSLVVHTQSVLDMLAEDGAPASAGIGRYYMGWPALAQSFADARFVLAAGRCHYGPGRAFLPRDLGMVSFVCRDGLAFKSELAHELLCPMSDKPDLIATLEAFFKTNLSASQTAQMLHIHRHTLDYRLNKIAQLTGLDPRRFECAEQLHAALLLEKMASASR